MFISMWAQDKNGLIGKNGLLPWRLPNDMRFFREHTMDRILVMGRKTYEGMGDLSLPYRRVDNATKFSHERKCGSNAFDR